MIFKAKLRKIGNSLGVLIPRDVITKEVGDVITLEVLGDNVITGTKPPVEKTNVFKVLGKQRII